MALRNPYNYSKPKNFKKKNLKKVKKDSKMKKRDNKQSKQDKYLKQKIMSAKPEELTFMLYQGLVKFLKKAKLFMEKGSKVYDKSNNSIQRSMAIIAELRATLDMDIEISENLDSMYEYMGRRLLDANLEKDIEILDEVIGYAEELRDTWKEAMTKV